MPRARKLLLLLLLPITSARPNTHKDWPCELRIRVSRTGDVELAARAKVCYVRGPVTLSHAQSRIESLGAVALCFSCAGAGAIPIRARAGFHFRFPIVLRITLDETSTVDDPANSSKCRRCLPQEPYGLYNFTCGALQRIAYVLYGFI